MTVYLVGAGPGDPGLLTVRGRDVLRRADVVLYDRLSVASLLDLAPESAELISVGKTPKAPSTPQAEINRLLVEKGGEGLTVVRLKGGDPFVFSRGGEEAAVLAEAGVPFEIVPGVSSAIAAPAYAGVPVTHRGVATSFTVVTGHEDPWAATETDWDAVARIGGTIVVLMGVATRGEIARRLIAAGRDPDTPIASVQWGTRPEQRTIRTTLGALGSDDIASPAVIVIGDVARLDLAWFERRPLFGRRIVVTRPRHQAGRLSELLVEAGAEPVEVPTIEIVDPADPGALVSAAGRAATYDWIVFASGNAVDRFVPLLRDARELGPARIAAIGTGTARSLSGFRLVPDLVPARAVAEALVEEMPAGPGRVLLPQARDARPVLAEGLLAKRWTVDVVEAYATVPASPGAALLGRAAAADAIAFTSASTVTGFLAAAGRDAFPPAVACIGPITADAARGAGVKVDVVADEHSLHGLVDALAAYFSRSTDGAARSGGP